MTVIAYKDGVLACDSLWSDGDIRATFKTKIRKLSNGLYVGTSGDNDDRAIIKLISDIEVTDDLSIDDFPSVAQLQELNQSMSMLIIHPRSDTNKIYVISTTNSGSESEGEGNSVYEITQDFYAVGSGSHVALGAMAAGANAEEACKIASRFEMHCMEPIHSLKTKKTKDEEIVIDSEAGC